MEIDKIKRVALGCASEEEQQEVKAWAEVSEERSRLLRDAGMFYGGNVSDEREEEKRIEGIWLRMQLPCRKRRMVVWRRWVAVAACVAVVACVALWM